MYTTRDIAYHIEKFKKYDRALNILGEDHKLQSKLLGIALREINCKTPETLFYSFVNLPGGKMSTRAGRVVYLDDIMQQITDLAMEKLGEIEDKFNIDFRANNFPEELIDNEPEEKGYEI